VIPVARGGIPRLGGLIVGQPFTSFTAGGALRFAAVAVDW